MDKILLVIDDEASHRLMVRAVTEDAGWIVHEAESGEKGLEVYASHPAITVALVDMKMPGMDGHETLKSLHAINQSLPVILLTAYGTVGSAVDAMKHGAFDYLTKPADNDELLLTLTRAHEYSCLHRENTRLKAEVSSNDALNAIIGNSPAINGILELIGQAGPSEATVLITGESGTGKELIAEALHATSSRSAKPLVKVNCAALPDQLLESELFGYEKGAFTGAVKDKPGRFQLASGGTLFLDEIGEIPLELQAKLLRAIQERVVEPLGSVKSLAVDVRILAATNKDLRQAVHNGTFREDLFFRLNVLEVASPALRHHLEDMPLLVNHLLNKLSQKNKKNIRSISPVFLEYLTAYDWPGNVRELENVLERALILSRADILEPDSLPAHILTAAHPGQSPRHQGQLPLNMTPSPLHQHPKGGAQAPLRQSPAGTGKNDSLGESEPREQQRNPQGNHRPKVSIPSGPSGPSGITGSFNESHLPHPQGSHLTHQQEYGSQAHLLEHAEKTALLKALALHSGHRQNTAEALGISRRTLQYKLKKYGLNKK